MYVQIYYIWIIKFFMFFFFQFDTPKYNTFFLQRIVILMFSCDVDHLIMFAPTFLS